MSERQRLPNRRMNRTELFFWKELELRLAVGFDRAGKVREVFVKGTKAGTDLEVWADHSCILISYLLQSGHDAQGLLQRLGAGIADTGYAVPSLIESVLSAARRLEEEEGADVRAFFDAVTPDSRRLRQAETTEGAET